jgi:hypothetical protein
VVRPRRAVAPTSQPTTTVHSRSATAFSDGVRPPVVIDRGVDRVAIARSLAAYGRWLEWHDPDPALVERAYAPRSGLARSMAKAAAEMRLWHERIQEVDRAPLDFEIVSDLENVVSFRVTERLVRRDIVDTKGRTLRHAGPATEHYLVLVTRAASDAPWRLLVVEAQDPPIEVRL